MGTHVCLDLCVHGCVLGTGIGPGIRRDNCYMSKRRFPSAVGYMCIKVWPRNKKLKVSREVRVSRRRRQPQVRPELCLLQGLGGGTTTNEEGFFFLNRRNMFSC